MKKVLVACFALFALVSAYGCSNTCEDVCSKQTECYTELEVPEDAQFTEEECNTACDEASTDNENYQECIDCFVDKECTAIFEEGACNDACAPAE